jgi:hypothetical protein
MLRMMELYLHFPTRSHAAVLISLSTGTTLPLLDADEWPDSRSSRFTLREADAVHKSKLFPLPEMEL